MIKPSPGPHTAVVYVRRTRMEDRFSHHPYGLHKKRWTWKVVITGNDVVFNREGSCATRWGAARAGRRLICEQIEPQHEWEVA